MRERKENEGNEELNANMKEQGRWKGKRCGRRGGSVLEVHETLTFNTSQEHIKEQLTLTGRDDDETLNLLTPSYSNVWKNKIMYLLVHLLERSEGKEDQEEKRI